VARLLPELVSRSGLPFIPSARRLFRYLAQYYPPFYYRGFLEKTVGFHNALRALDDAGVEGDVVECGVGRGLSLFVLAHFMARSAVSRQLYAFDSFKGFPKPVAADLSDRRPVEGDLWSDTSLRHVVGHFTSGGLDAFLRDRCHIVPGFFAETLPGRPDPQRVALLNLDVDLYGSYRDCLQHFGPRVTGVIVYDEYRSPKWPGATRAIDEALPGLGHLMLWSPVMERFVSVPAASRGSQAWHRLADALAWRPADMASP
jgi:hypothetical protein